MAPVLVWLCIVSVYATGVRSGRFDDNLSSMCISKTKCTGMEGDVLDDSSAGRLARPRRSSYVFGEDLFH
jgi:hypothetical protein